MHWVFTLNKREGKKESVAIFFSLSRVMEINSPSAGRGVEEILSHYLTSRFATSA